jgi:hypothetical protein
MKEFLERGGKITDKTGQEKGLKPGDFVLEVEDGAARTRVKVCVTTEVVGDRIVHRCKPCGVNEDGTEEDYGLEPGEHVFQLGLSDGDPAVVLGKNLEVEALRAHRARKQLAALAALNLPPPPTIQPDD